VEVELEVSPPASIRCLAPGWLSCMLSGCLMQKVRFQGPAVFLCHCPSPLALTQKELRARS
jgi:hypothetical protein